MSWTASFPWVTPRFVGLVAAVGVVYALSAFAPVLAVAAIVTGALLIGLLAADAALGPHVAAVHREARDRLAQRLAQVRARVVAIAAARFD